MLINCPHCSARVDGKEEKLLLCDFPGTEHEDPRAYQVCLLLCPSCSEAIVGVQKMVGPDGDITSPDAGWTEAKRVWPNPEPPLFGHFVIPTSVWMSLHQARECLTYGIYTASVVMSGRALEAVARHFHVGEKAERLMLARGLDELHESGKIDERLYQWGKELNEHRNLAAHATDRTFSKEDAEDLYEFVNAICDYLFVMQDRYDRFMQRKARRQKAATP